MWNLDDDIILPLLKQYPQVEKIPKLKETLLKLDSWTIYKLNRDKLNWLLKNESNETLFWFNLFIEDLKYSIELKAMEIEREERRVEWKKWRSKNNGPKKYSSSY
jgi:hypothetical protein